MKSQYVAQSSLFGVTNCVCGCEPGRQYSLTMLLLRSGALPDLVASLVGLAVAAHVDDPQFREEVDRCLIALQCDQATQGGIEAQPKEVASPPPRERRVASDDDDPSPPQKKPRPRRGHTQPSLDVRSRLCVGDNIVPTVDIDGENYVAIQSRMVWLASALGMHSRAKLSELPTACRLRDARSAQRGKKHKHTRSCWKLDNTKSPCSHSVVTIDGVSLKVRTALGPVVWMAATEDSITWLVKSFGADMGILERETQVEPAQGDAHTKADAIDDGADSVFSSTQINELKAEGLHYCKSRQALRVYRDGTRSEFRFRRVRTQREFAAEEINYQVERARTFRETGQCSPLQPLAMVVGGEPADEDSEISTEDSDHNA